MANIPIRDIQNTGTPASSSFMVYDDGASMKRTTVGEISDAVRPVASEVEATAGANNTKVSTPLRVKQYVDAQIGVSIASKAQGDLANSAVQSVGSGTGISIDASTPTAPVANLSSGAVASLALADSAVQPGDIATVATSGDYGDLINKPTLGTAAALDYGVTAGKAVRLDGAARLPMVDASQLLNLPGGGDMVASVYDLDGVHADAFGGAVPAETVSDADALVVATAPAAVQTKFYDADKLSGSAVEFTHSGTSNPSVAGQIDIDVNGVTHFYTRSNRILRPEQFGMKAGGNATTNRLGLVAMLAVQNLTGNDIDMGRHGDVYEIDDTVTHEFTRSSKIYGSGATIKLNSGAVKLFAVRFQIQNHNPRFAINHTGFHVDANLKAPNALWYENLSTAYSDTTSPDLFLTGVGGSNGKRVLLTDYWGGGVTIRGAFRKCISRDQFCEGMVSASGANDASNGIMGMYIGRDSNGLFPMIKEVHNFTCGPIYSEDTTMTYNMDGLHIADVFPAHNADRQAASTFVSGGSFRNPWGRAIKVQGFNVDINAPMVTLTDGPLVSAVKTTTCCVSLQYADGTVRGLRLFSNGAVPISAVDGTARSYAVGKMSIIGTQVNARSVAGNLAQVAYRYSDSGAPRGSMEVCDSNISGLIVDRFARFYSRLNGLENLVMNNNWAEAVAVNGALVENDSGSNVVNGTAYGNYHASTTRTLIATSTATATFTSAGNYGFS